MDPTDHDLLIEINTKVTLFNDSFNKHCTENTTQFTQMHGKISSTHSRMDKMNGTINWVIIAGVLSIILVVIVALVKIGAASG